MGGFIMKLVSMLLGFFSFTLALESETSGALLQESEEATAGASSIEYGIIKLVDRGRLTPFGRTYDISLTQMVESLRSCTLVAHGSAIQTTTMDRLIPSVKKTKMLGLKLKM